MATWPLLMQQNRPAEQVALGLEYGAKIAEQTILSGSNLLMFGEMGIGNTSSASALLSALSSLDIDYCIQWVTVVAGSKF